MVNKIALIDILKKSIDNICPINIDDIFLKLDCDGDLAIFDEFKNYVSPQVLEYLRAETHVKVPISNGLLFIVSCWIEDDEKLYNIHVIRRNPQDQSSKYNMLKPTTNAQLENINYSIEKSKENMLDIINSLENNWKSALTLQSRYSIIIKYLNSGDVELYYRDTKLDPDYLLSSLILWNYTYDSPFICQIDKANQQIKDLNLIKYHN